MITLRKEIIGLIILVSIFGIWFVYWFFKGFVDGGKDNEK
jgi:hypothetical protein